jgi:hypothetical protein
MKLVKSTEKPCSEYIREVLEFDQATESYRIPQNLDLSQLPEGIVDAFLDFVNSMYFSPEEENAFYKLIKDGTFKVECGDEEELSKKSGKFDSDYSVDEE